MANLVKYSCGCIGMPRDCEDKALIFKACDRDVADPEIQLHERSMKGKKAYALSEGIEAKVLAQLSRLVDDGNRWREFKRLIRD